MANEYVYVTGQDGEIYEIRPTDALLDFLQRLAEGEDFERECAEQTLSYSEVARD
ncbi:MAG TPA: hypothetical protein VGF67_27350 [Ktedonobacteraceae bacterium]|jgi:hypothetical protein